VTAPHDAEACAAQLAALREECARLEVLAATLLCELGRVPDPRVEGLAGTAVEAAEVIKRGPRTFAPEEEPRPLTHREARHVLALYTRALAALGKERGNG
jgi:hypothetical protein